MSSNFDNNNVRIAVKKLGNRRAMAKSKVGVEKKLQAKEHEYNIFSESKKMNPRPVDTKPDNDFETEPDVGGSITGAAMPSITGAGKNINKYELDPREFGEEIAMQVKQKISKKGSGSTGAGCSGAGLTDDLQKGLKQGINIGLDLIKLISSNKLIGKGSENGERLIGAGFWSSFAKGFRKGFAAPLKLVQRVIPGPPIIDDIADIIDPGEVKGLEFMGSGKKIKNRRKKASADSKRMRRGRLISKVMKEQGLKLPDASKYIKEHNLEY